MRWPWQRETEPPDVAAIARAAAQEAMAPVLSTLERLNSTPYGLPDPTGRPPDGLPYRWNQPWRYTVLQAPYKPPDSPVDIDTLRALADFCDIVRACILHLTREVLAVPIRVVPRDAKEKSKTVVEQCAEALAWLDTRKGGLGGPRSRRAHFEARMIDDLCIVGATAVFWQHNRRGELIEVIPIDASTIRPRVDIYGWDEARPFEQWVYGVLMRAFEPEELTYDGLYPVSYSPYYRSPTEYLVSVADTQLAVDQWNKLWLTEGTGGTEKLALPADWTPEQVMNFQQYWKDLLSGNLKARQRTLFVPSGTTKLNDQSRKDQDFQEFQVWQVHRICSMFGVQPASIGYVGQQYKHTQEDSMASTTEFGVGPILEQRTAIYDEVLERLGFGYLRVQNVSGEEESEEARAKRLVSLVGGGIKTPNEARAIEGDDPVEGGDTLFMPSTLVPIEHALIPPPDPMEMEKLKGSFNQTAADEKNAADDGATDETSGAENQRMLSDWRRLSLKRLAQGKAPVLFRGLSDELTQRVYAGLVNCRDAASIEAVFEAARENG